MAEQCVAGPPWSGNQTQVYFQTWLRRLRWALAVRSRESCERWSVEGEGGGGVGGGGEGGRRQSGCGHHGYILSRQAHPQQQAIESCLTFCTNSINFRNQASDRHQRIRYSFWSNTHHITAWNAWIICTQMQNIQIQTNKYHNGIWNTSTKYFSSNLVKSLPTPSKYYF